MCQQRGWVFAAVLLAVVSLGPVAALAQGVYSLEFQSITEGGATATSATYEADQQITAIGAAAAGLSTNYEVTNVLDVPQPPAEVQLWMFY